MNSKNMENCQANPKIDNETPEVLVLPPRALLDKFGISLGDIGKFLNVPKSSSEGGPSNHVVELYGESVTSNVSYDVSKIDLNESSIMKTANLMKKSLFLSPTFSNSNSINSSLREDVLTSTASELEINSSEYVNKNDAIITSSQLDSEILPSNQVSTINMAHQNRTEELVSITSFMSVANDSVTVNNNNLIVTDGRDNVGFDFLSDAEKEIGNINIEENINNISIETSEISTQENECYKEKCKQRNISSIVHSSEKTPQHKKIVIDNDEKSILKSQYNLKAYTQKKNESITFKDKINCRGAQNSDMNDSVTRVAMILKEYLQNKKDVNVKRTLQCKSNIEGVEKPGGYKNYNLTLKRENNPKMYTIKARTKTRAENKIVPDTVEQITSNNINVTNEGEVTKVKTFCVCSDFGSYNYYGGEDYEHIHFWEQKHTKSALDAIFSIYYHDDTNSSQNQISYNEAVNDMSECNYICIDEVIEPTPNDDKCKKRENILESTLIEIDVPIYCDDQIIKEKNNKFNNASEENRICETELNISTKMRDEAETGPSKTSRKQRKRKTERDCSEGSPDNKKVRNADADANNEVIVEIPPKREKVEVICAVCHKNIPNSKWFEHVAKKHSYLAWMEGEEPLDVTKAKEVKEHLSKMLQKFGILVCGRCGLERSDISKYLSHVNSCDGEPASVEVEISKHFEVVTCAVCQMEVSDWYNHIGSAHDYLAYKEGDTAVDFNDEDAVRKHLAAISKQYNGLKCSKCGCRRQFVKAYLSHMKKCDVEVGDNFDNSLSSVKCGVCKEEVYEDDWIQHIEQEHNYLAWEVGDTPLDINDPEAVHNHLYTILKQIECLVCTKCGCKRKYVKGYQTHFKQCTSKTGYTPDKRRFRYIRKKRLKPVLQNFDESSTVTCGVCGLVKNESEWLKHIEQEHHYLAWKFGDSPIDFNNTRATTGHLNNISRYFDDGLLCSKCGKRRKCVRIFLKHIQTCQGDSSQTNDSILNESEMDTSVEKSVIEETKNVTCGVCKREIDKELWFQHIGEEHYYLAWKDTEKPLDLTDTMALREYLYDLSQVHGQLTCKKCGLKRKYVKPFLAHIAVCDSSLNLNLDTSDTSMSTSFHEDVSPDATVKCGVCKKEMENRKWEFHMRVHNYIAWKEGQKPLDTNDEQAVNAYLYDLSKAYDGLTCAKCNIKKKYVKTYRGHVAMCHGDIDVETVLENQQNRETYECAICHETGPVNKFKSHAMKEHYNVAWMVGDIPIDVKTTSSVEKYLKEYQKSHSSLVCNKCGLTRASVAGFFAHVVQCGRSEREMEMYKSVCEICNTKYLGVYKHTHMAIHRLEEARKKFADKGPEVVDAVPEVSGKRRAAQKAQNVIKNITDVTGKDNEEDVEDEGEYKCPEESSSSESEESGVSETEDQPETEVDEDLSDTENRIRNRKSTSSTFSTSHHDRIPFDVKDPSTYIAKSYRDFSNANLKASTLFPQWLSCEYDLVPDADLPKYMPPLAESCQVQFCSKNNSTYKVFEAKADKGVSLFVGASVNSVSWVPSKPEQPHPYLAVNCFSGPDAPRIDAFELSAHSGLIQIWDFKDMHALPSFVFGVAHDFGTVWGMDWCPSGACELLPENPDNTFVRLGLMAVACSNGAAYIYSVPHPSIVDTDNLVYKLKPVAELRLFRDDNKKAQATAITWSTQKGHAIILVGYSNGMIAMYNLECDSPLLSYEEDGVRVFYPFHDERSHNVCVTDVKAFVSGGSVCGTVSASPCGVKASLASGRHHVPLTAERLLLTPHWPSAVLAGNSDIINQAVNEVEWWGHGRRVGSMSTACGCLVCGRLAAYFPPLIKTMLLHPLYNDRRDIQIKAKIDIMALDKTTETESSSKGRLEPDTYEETIKMYGIKFDLATNLKKHEKSQNINKPKPRNAERYPLADVTSVAFCPIPKYHKRLAIATHGGIIFVIST